MGLTANMCGSIFLPRRVNLASIFLGGESKR
jgi:hypothetical protein